MLKYKFDVFNLLKSKGYELNNSKTRILNGSTIEHLRKSEMVGLTSLNKLCKLLDMQPGDIIEYIPDEDNVTE